jgi:hypothetical protein
LLLLSISISSCCNKSQMQLQPTCLPASPYAISLIPTVWHAPKGHDRNGATKRYPSSWWLISIKGKTKKGLCQRGQEYSSERGGLPPAADSSISRRGVQRCMNLSGLALGGQRREYACLTSHYVKERILWQPLYILRVKMVAELPCMTKYP